MHVLSKDLSRGSSRGWLILHCLVCVRCTVSEVSATTTLTASGPLCADQTTVLTCTVPQGISIRWTYRGSQFGGLITPSQPPPSGPISVSGVEFTLSLLEDSSPDLVSQLSFTASTDVDGAVVVCAGVSPTGLDGMVDVSTGSITLQVQQICKATCDIIKGGRTTVAVNKALCVHMQVNSSYWKLC